VDEKANLGPLLQAVLDKVTLLSPVKYQGATITDCHHTRLKVKSPQYVYLAEMEDKHQYESRRRKEKYWLLILRTSYLDADIFIKLYDTWKNWYSYVKTLFDELCNKIDSIYPSIKDITDDPKFASHIPKSKVGTYFWKLRKTKYDTLVELLTSPQSIADKQTTDALENFFRSLQCELFHNLLHHFVCSIIARSYIINRLRIYQL